MDFPRATINIESLVELARSVGIIELHIFGSILREDFNADSDVDLLVRFSSDSHYSLFNIFDIQQKFEKLLGRSVDLVEIDSLVNPYRRENILRYARKIYAA